MKISKRAQMCIKDRLYSQIQQPHSLKSRAEGSNQLLVTKKVCKRVEGFYNEDEV